MHEIADDGHLALGIRLNAVDQRPGHIATMGQHALQLHERCRRLDLVVMIHPVGQRLPILHRLTAMHREVRHHTQNAGLQLTIEAVHDRKHRYQHRYAQHQAQCGNQCNHRNKTVAGTGAGIAQPHIEG